MLQQIVEPGEEVEVERGLWTRITLLPGFGILLAIGCVLIGQVNGKCDKKPSPTCVIDGLQGANVLIKKMSIPPIVLLVYRSTVYDYAVADDDFIVIVFF